MKFTISQLSTFYADPETERSCKNYTEYCSYGSHVSKASFGSKP